MRMPSCNMISYLLPIVSVLVLPVMAMAQGGFKLDPQSDYRHRGEDWPTVKCTRYRQAWQEATTRQGMKGLGADFLENHRLFLDSNCLENRRVCPVSPEEFKLANTLILLGMNRGMSGTFFPFSCKKNGEGAGNIAPQGGATPGTTN